MGKKGKDKKKGKGAEKTKLKTEKKLCNKFKKILKAVGEEDIELVVKKFERSKEVPVIVTETIIEPPSARINFSFTVHPLKDQLILFGGEYFNGQKTFVYNDLIFYNINKNTWTNVKSTGSPPPRCGHQMVGTAANNGQLWVFGGEFISPSQSQFYHYQDLWVYHMSSKNWEKVNAPNGPSARSGHRMVLIKKNIFLFGGFHDKLTDYKYFNDVYVFNLEDYKWSKITAGGIPPAPRSGCCMTALPDNRILIYGGYSKEKVKKDVDKGHVYSDAFILGPDKHNPTQYKWEPIKLANQKQFPARCSMPMVTSVTGQSAYCFGGVFDTEEDEENLSGNFFNDFYQLNLERLNWHKISLKSDKCKTKSSSLKSTADETKSVEISNPSPRMNCGLAIKHGILYLYGGACEDGDKQLTYTDMYSIDLKKLDQWKTLVEDESSKMEWVDSESESDSTSSSDSESDSENDGMDTD